MDNNPPKFTKPRSGEGEAGPRRTLSRALACVYRATGWCEQTSDMCEKGEDQIHKDTSVVRLVSSSKLRSLEFIQMELMENHYRVLDQEN